MFPILIRIGPLTIHTYGVLVATGFLVAIILTGRQARKQGISSERIIDLGFYILLSAIIGSRLFFVLTQLDHFLRKPLDIFKIWEGGLVFYGGLLLAVPVVILYVRKHKLDLWSIMDIFAPSVAIGHAIGRLGCFSAGCCYGKPAEGLPLAVIFHDHESLARIGIPLHPTQLYESFGELINFFILITLRKHQSFKGQLFWTYILLYSIIRFFVELFRGDEIRGFLFAGVSVSQGLSIAMAITAIVAMLMKKRILPAP